MLIDPEMSSSDDDSLGRQSLFSLEQDSVIERCEELMSTDQTKAGDMMKKTLLNKGYLASIMSTKYVYISEEMGWVLVTSDASAKMICETLGLYAPVNYMIAAKTIMEFLENTYVPYIVVGPSFSQGRVRCHFYKVNGQNPEATSIKLEACIPLNHDRQDVNKELMYSARFSYCTCPTKIHSLLKSVTIPNSLKFNTRGYLCKWIYDVFGEDSETVLWIIGDMIADFGNKRLFMLYGPGGVGKTSVVNIISSISSNKVVQVAGKYMAKSNSTSRNYANSLPDSIKALLPNTRLVVVGDVEVTNQDEVLNIQTVKELTGGDDSPLGRISVTSVMSLNRLFSYKYMADYTIVDRTRRVVVVPTVMRRSIRDLHFNESGDKEKVELIALSIATRFKYDIKPPLTTKALIMTLFQAKFTFALVIVCIDEDSSVVEIYAATRVLCHKFNIREEDMQMCLRSVGSKCCKIFSGVHVIANITVRHGKKIYAEGTRSSSSSNKHNKSSRSSFVEKEAEFN
jgi:hypothetical protein